jgi:hypothetical protein
VRIGRERSSASARGGHESGDRRREGVGIEQDAGLAFVQLEPELGEGEPEDRQDLGPAPRPRHRHDVVDPPDVPSPDALESAVGVPEHRVREDGGRVGADRETGGTPARDPLEHVQHGAARSPVDPDRSERERDDARADRRVAGTDVGHDGHRGAEREGSEPTTEPGAGRPPGLEPQDRNVRIGPKHPVRDDLRPEGGLDRARDASHAALVRLGVVGIQGRETTHVDIERDRSHRSPPPPARGGGRSRRSSRRR